MKFLWHVFQGLMALGFIIWGAVLVGRGSVTEDATVIALGVITVAMGTALAGGLVVKEELLKFLPPQQVTNSSEDKNHQTEV